MNIKTLVAFATIITALSMPVWAEGDHDQGDDNRGHGNSQNHENEDSHGNSDDNRGNSNRREGSRPGSGRGLLVTNHHVYYPGDPLYVRVVYPRSLTAVWDGTAEGHIVVYMPEGGSIAVPMPTSPDATSSLIELDSVDTSILPAGDYQLGLILTVPGGDPLNVNDWFGGFSGLLSTARLRISGLNTPDPEDADGDGEFDGDTAGDGFVESTDTNTDGSTPPDGGTTPPDGGTTPPDGGTTPSDGGTTPPDGGTTPPDGGTTPPPTV